MTTSLVIAEPLTSDLVSVDFAMPTGLALVHDGSPPEVMRRRIGEITAALLAAPDHLDMRVEHTIQDGMYLRKLFIPKGTLLVGQLHLKACLNIVAMGEIDVLTEHTSARLRAGFTGVSLAGIQKVGLAQQDTVFINVFRTDKTDIKEIEDEIAVIGNTGVRHDPARDRVDYQRFLVEYGLDDAVVRTVVEDMSDHAPLPVGSHKLRVGPSSIAGVGTFAVVALEENEAIVPARIGDRRTVAGRRTNHSPWPNCRFVPSDDGGLTMVANEAIDPGRELTVDYRHAARMSGVFLPVEELQCLSQ